MSSSLCFLESANLAKVQLLNNLENSKLKEIVLTKKLPNEDKVISNIKTYLQESKVAKGKIERKYNLTNNKFKPHGAINLTKLTPGLRNYLFDEYEFWEVRNLDIFITMLFGRSQYSLDMKHCDSYLKRLSSIPDEVIKTILNNDDVTTGTKEVIELSEEVNKVKLALFDDLPEELSHIEFRDCPENEGSNTLLDVIETLKKEDVFTKITKSFEPENILGFTQNGFACKIRTNTDLLLTNAYGKYWKENKETINTHKLENDMSVGLGFDPSLSYEKVKEKFQKTHFMVTNPFTYCKLKKNKDGKHEVACYNKGEFKDLVANINFMEVTDKGPKEQEFFSRWLKDIERKEYDKLVFEPTYEFESETEFNLFQGFNYDTYKTRPFKHQQHILDRFLQLFKNITNNNEECYNYLLDYFAHIIQKPNTRNSKILLFLSKPGIGKDLLFSIMRKLMGEGFLYQTEDLTKAFGTFNGEMEKMLLFVCNETDSKNGFYHKEQLKAHATNEFTTINQKNRKTFIVKNYSRTFICTNNLNAVDIPYNDRRYVVFSGTQRKIPEEEFGPLYDLIETDTKLNRYGLYTIYKFLDNRDISSFNPRHAPVTEAYNDMKERNISPVYEFLYDCIVEGKLEQYFSKGSYDEHEKTRNVRATTSSVIDAFNRWIREHRIKCDDMHFKRLKTLFNAIGIRQKSCRMHGGAGIRAYEFKLTELEEKLRDMIKRTDELSDTTDDEGWHQTTKGYVDTFNQNTFLD